MQTPQTKAQAESLERVTPEQASGFMLASLVREGAILQTIQKYTPIYERQFHTVPEIRSLRIAKNHAQLMALIDALEFIIPLSVEQKAAAQAQLVDMAIQRQQAISADHPIVQEFWDTFDYLERDAEHSLNHAHESNLIAINLNDFAKVATLQQQKIPSLLELKRYLRDSRARQFIEIKAVRSALTRVDLSLRGALEILKCWIFKREQA